MRLLRHGPAGKERPGLLDAAGHIRDLSDHLSDINPETLSGDRLKRLGGLDPASFPVVGGNPRLGPPVNGVGKIVAIGLNYADHAAEAGMDLPDEPILFSKAITSLSGPTDPIILPKGSQKGDWEAELAVVISRRAQYVDEDDAGKFIAGYAIMNDVSERAFNWKPRASGSRAKALTASPPSVPGW